MRPLRVNTLKTIHFGLLVGVVFLFSVLRLILDSGDVLLKGLSFCSSLLGSMWALILVLIPLIKNKAEDAPKFLLSFYRNLLVNTRFLAVSNVFLCSVALGLCAFLAAFQAVEFRSQDSEVEVFLSSNELELDGPGYESLGIARPDKPLKVRLPVGKKRFSFESLTDKNRKDARLIHLKPFHIGKTYVYTVNLQ